MTIAQQYQSQILNTKNEVELIQTMRKFKSQYLQLWKFAAFIGYQFVALSSMAFYGYSFKKKLIKPHQRTGKINHKQLTLVNIVKKGSRHGLIISSLYIGGLCLLVPKIFPFQIFYKLTEIESKIHSFATRYDPFYQQTMLYAKMRKCGLSEELMQEIRQELDEQKNKLIKQGGLTPETIKHLYESQAWYKIRHEDARGMEEFN